MDIRWSAVAALFALALAGCASSSDETQNETIEGAEALIAIAPDPAMFLGTIANDHATGDAGHLGHQIHALHEGSHNLKLLDHNTLTEGLLQPSGGYTELHAVGELAVVSSLTSTRGVTLVDISDPSNLRVLSHIYNLDDNWDARLSDDGLYLFIGCQGSGAFDCTGLDESGEQPQLVGGGPCRPNAVVGDLPQTCPGGIAVYDIQDPTRPIFEGYLPMGFTHNVFSFMIDGLYYFANAAGNIGEFDAEKRTFQIASTNITATHDIAVQQHPITGEWLLYTGSMGMSIWNVSDPFDAHLIGTVDPDQYDERIAPLWHEQTPMPCLLDGRHITIGAGENGLGATPDLVGVVDTTDPRNPVYVGDWILPDHASITENQANYRFSLHNIDGNCQGQVAVGHYHAGVWVFDVSTKERQAQPVTLGYYQPHELPDSPLVSPVVTAPIGALVSADVPNVWTAQWTHNGTVLMIPDMTTGLYSLQPQWEYETIGRAGHDH